MILENGFSRWMSATRCILIIFLLSLVACTRQRGYEESLAKADSLMNMAPDSSLFILDSLEQSAQDFSKSNLRRWQLLRMMAQNKCDTVFRSDSLQLVLTDYYDHYGTSNEKMWAYYLLGRAYYDMGEAPMAQKAFYEATEKADASSADCDYWNLCRIYFQLSDLYYQSMLPNQMLSTLNLAQTYAEKSGDTLSFITAIGRKTLAYELSDKPDSLILCAEETSKQFLVYGQKELSSQYLSLAIHPLILKGELGKASEYIALYEANSGYFDEKNNIQEGREIFYYSKGLYYLKTEKPDSAEWMFRKLLNLAKNINDTHAACMGLRNKYEVTGPIDSLAKYAILSEQFDDSLYLLNYRGDLQKNEQMYNYTRHLVASEKLAVKAENQKRKAERWKMSLIICLISAIGGFFILRNRKNKIVNRKVQEIELLQNTIAQMEEENSPKD